MSLNLFDAHSYIGRWKNYQAGYFHSKADLLAEMDHLGIAEALVLDTLSRELDPRAGNPRVVSQCQDEPRLHPAWSLAPPVPSLPYPLDELRSRMADADVRAVWMFPGHLTFSLGDWSLRPILEVLEAERVPLFVDPSSSMVVGERDLTDWDALVRICHDHPGLPVIATEARMYWMTRQSLTALEAAPNLHIELSPFWLFAGIEFVCREFGADRLVFGTRLPVRDAAATVAQLQYADISEDDRHAIAGGNLRRLLSEALPGRPAPAAVPEPVAPPPDPARGRPYAAVRAAEEPFAGEVLIDMHSHVGFGAPYFIPGSSPRQVARELRRYGFSRLLTFAFAGLNADWAWGNDVAFEAACEDPDLALPLAAVNLQDTAEVQAEMARGCDGLGFWDVKLPPWWNGYPEERIGGNIGPWAGRLGLAKAARNARLVFRRGRTGVRPEGAGPLTGPVGRTTTERPGMRLPAASRPPDRARWGPTTHSPRGSPHGAPPQPGGWATGTLSCRQCPRTAPTSAWRASSATSEG